MAIITQISNGTSLSGVTGTKIPTSTSAANNNGNTAAKDNATKLKNQFLSILLTQMQHQNPLDPMDTKEFTGQLTQFSALEQQIDTNTKLDSVVSALTKSGISEAFSYLNQTVDLKSSSTVIKDGKANWTYAIPENAKSVAISVTDSAGKVVYSGSMTNAGGGTDITAGTYNLGLVSADLTRAAKEGEVFKVNITAKDKTNKAITADIHTAVTVDSIQSDGKGTYLQSGGMAFAIGDVNKILKAPSTPTTSTTTSTT
jgi:flagellar basal-body rod modification protein FlgD